MTSDPAPRLRGGIVTALLTPFDAQGDVDLAALDTLVDFQLEAGVDGLFVLGTAGEGLLMSRAERGDVAARVVQRVAGRLPVVVHCGAVETRAAAELAGDAAEAGAGAVAAIPPLFFPYDDAGLMHHFRSLAQAAPDLDHYVYQNPARTGYAMSTDLVHRLFAEIDPVRGVKDTGDSVGRIASYLSASPDIQVFAGNNMVVLGALTMGAVGAVSTTANVVPDLFVELYRAFRNGDVSAARQLQFVAVRLQHAVADLPYVAAVKSLAALRGLPGGRTRSPLPGLSDAQAETLKSRVRADPTLSDLFTDVGH